MKMPSLFAFLAVASLPLYLVKFSVWNIPFNLLEILVLTSIFWWLGQRRKGSFFLSNKANRLFFLGASFLFLGLFSSFLANNPAASGLGIIKSWFVLPFLFFLVLLDLFHQNRLLLRRFLLVLYVSVFLVSVIALAHKLAGLVTYDQRLAAFYLSPNFLAMFLAPGVLLGLDLMLRKYVRKDFGYAFFLLSASLASILIALYLTFSYATWLALLLAVLFSLFRLQTEKRTFQKISAFLLLFLFVLSCFFFLQFKSAKMQGFLQHNPRSSLVSRQMIWRAATKMLADHPLAGIGPGNFQATYLAYQRYYPPYLEWAVPQPHNIYLAFWLQTGLMGLVGFLLMLVSLFWKLTMDYRQQKIASWALFGFFAYLILHGFLDTPYWKNDLAYLFWLFAAFTLAPKDAATEA